MNPTDTLLWRRGLEKLAVAPSALTDAEREVIALYGSETDRRRMSDAARAPLMTKAAPPAPAASKAWVRKAFEHYTAGVAATLKQALGERDATIRALETRVLELEAQQASHQELVP